MWFTFDIGNSAIKGGAFEGNLLHHAFSLPHDPGGMEAGLDEAINRVRTAGNAIDRTGIASVVPDSAACLTRLLQDRGHTPVQIRSTMRLPFRLDAASPKRWESTALPPPRLPGSNTENRRRTAFSAM